jgi:hypothetical protein
LRGQEIGQKIAQIARNRGEFALSNLNKRGREFQGDYIAAKAAA